MIDPDRNSASATPRRSRTVLQLVGIVLAVSSMALAVWQIGRAGNWTAGFYFDEEWRADFIRSANIPQEMLRHDTPIPIGWVLFMKPVTALVPYAPTYWRVISAGFMAAGLVVIGILFVRIGQRGERRPVLPPLLGMAAASTLIFLTPVRGYLYFNNYGFEVLYVALMVLAVEELGRARRALPVLCVLIAASPLFVLGGLLVLPGLFACAGWWAWRSAARLRALIQLGLSGLVALTLFIVVYLTLYRPIAAKPSISRFWITVGASLGGHLTVVDLFRKMLHQTRDGMVGQRAFEAGGIVLSLATLVVVAGAVGGLITIWRRWPWLLGITLSAQLAAVLASATTHWPITLERVNLCFQIFGLAIITLGVAQGVYLVARRTPLPALITGAAMVALVSGLWFRHQSPSPRVFGRGLLVDLRVVAESQAARNLVVEYHPLAYFFAHDALINTAHPGHLFALLGETDGDLSLRSPIDLALQRAQLHSGDMLWCVIPFEVGPTGATRACQFSDPSLHEIVNVRGQQSIVRGYVKA